ncbi:predicted protein [Postia placenta Mad-698-R]|uniref:Uncharacterized protein n=1 Tax=Postia placenta MAD-698-R-SB12 TaxID=670580 RepID=A0A1X6N4B1_9APHY|nr:hypothetical protein POSPLADRAFT_1033078 [Postia placenta MAD-698-R-SB12]EED84856.1 predicted protein [Postia placenta Mad-698-R]OSX63434.1 hypothetical protein POSPLADRAFT_1033078 [Postia placenta MAD-698-R-SB12]
MAPLPASRVVSVDPSLLVSGSHFGLGSRWLILVLIFVGALVIFGWSLAVIQVMRYCREVSTAGEAEVKDPEAASVDEHKASASIGAPGLDVYAPLNSILGEETSDCWPAAAGLDLPVRLDPHPQDDVVSAPDAVQYEDLYLATQLSFSSIADTFQSAYEPPRARSIADSWSTVSRTFNVSPSSSSIYSAESCPSLDSMLFDALNSGDDEACIVAAKARLTCDVWDDLEADMSMSSECSSRSSSPTSTPALSDADTESVFSTDSSSVCLMDSPSAWMPDAPSVYSAESVKTEVPYLDLLLSLALPSDLRVPPVGVKTMEPEPVFSSSVSVLHYGSLDDFGAVGLAF